MGWMIMATHGFNDGHHWLSNGLSHVWCHAIICHAMYLSICVWETYQLHLNLNTWVKIFVSSEYIGYCGLQNIHYTILLTIIPFNWYFCSVIWILMLIYMVYVNMGARYYISSKKGCWLNILSYSYKFFFISEFFFVIIVIVPRFPSANIIKAFGI